MLAVLYNYQLHKVIPEVFCYHILIFLRGKNFLLRFLALFLEELAVAYVNSDSLGLAFVSF